MKKRLIALTSAVLMIATVLSGCVKMDPEQTLATVEGVEIKLDIANFYARYQQMQIESMYGSYMGGAKEMWQQVAEGENYEELTKESLLDSLIVMHILEMKQEEYDVSLNAEEKEKITEAAQAFLAANGEEEKEVISATQETVERMLTLMTIESKMRTAMTADVDTNIPDSEAAQKKIEYAQILFTTTDEDGVTSVVEEEGKEDLKKEVEEFAKEAEKVEKEEDFEALVEEYEYTFLEATFDSESTHVEAAMLEAVDTLKEGEITEVIETERGFYVAKLVSLLDREATDAKKEGIISERKAEMYQTLCDEWKDEADVERDDNAWKAISFVKQGVTMKVEEEPETSEIETETEIEAAE